MIFANYFYDNKEEIGIVLEDKIISVKNLLQRESPITITDMFSLIEIFDDALYQKIQNSLSNPSPYYLPLKDVKLLSPIPFPKRNVICLGKNYTEHVKEVKAYTGGNGENPADPIYFTKMASPIMGPEDTLLRHESITDSVDYEVELAVIIGKKGINIRPEEVEEYIFGYSIGNDISARDLQKKHVNWFKGKSLDTHCVMGPWIVYKDNIAFPPALNIKCSVNDEIRQDSNTRNMIFDISAIISDFSKGTTLMPGDIIFTGTPSGVGLGFDPPRYLNSGDKITCWIEKIGTLENIIK